jgi:hypothetical protein
MLGGEMVNQAYPVAVEQELYRLIHCNGRHPGRESGSVADQPLADARVSPLSPDVARRWQEESRERKRAGGYT